MTQSPWNQSILPGISEKVQDSTYKKSTCEPEDGGEESKCDISLPPPTDTLLRNIAPAIQGLEKLS